MPKDYFAEEIQQDYYSSEVQSPTSLITKPQPKDFYSEEISKDYFSEEVKPTALNRIAKFATKATKRGFEALHFPVKKTLELEEKGQELLKARPERPYALNITTEAIKELELAKPSSYLLGMLGFAGAGRLAKPALQKLAASPQGRAFLEKQLPTLAKRLLSRAKAKPFEVKPPTPEAIKPPIVDMKSFYNQVTGKVKPEGILPKKAENLNIERLPENIRKPIAEVIKEKPLVGKAPHITHEELIKTASELKDTPSVDYLLSKPEGTFQAEVLKARQGKVFTINEILSKDLGELSQNLKTDLEQPIMGLRKIGSELGRALEQNKITPFAKENMLRKIDKKILAIDKDPLFKNSPAGNKLKTDLSQLKKMISGDEIKPDNWDKLYYGWLNSILSDPRTHMVNVGSNTLFALAKIPERFMAAMMDLPLTGLGKLGVKKLGHIPLTGQRQVFFGEVPAMIQGMLKKGVKSPKVLGSKFEQMQMFGGDKWLPTGLLQTEDKLAKNVIGKMEMFAQMYRAKAQGRTGLLGLENIKQEQLYRTFQNEPGVIANWIMKSRNVPYIGPALFRWVMPFVKTPANIMSAAVERMAGGALFLGKAKTQPQLAERLGVMALGSTVSAWAGIQYLKGNITGDAPTDPAEKDAFYDMGKQPNSIRLFGFWIPFERIEPLGTALALTVNVIQDYKTSDKEIPAEKIMDAVNGLGQTLTNKSYHQGMTNMMKAVSDPERYGSRWGEGIASGLLAPGLLNFLAQLQDPYIRQPKGVGEKIKSRIPFWSEEVSPKLTAFGEPIKRETPYLPLRISKERQDIVRSELENIGGKVGFPSRVIGKQKFTQKQYTELLMKSGREIRQRLEWMIKQPEWQTMSIDEKNKDVEKVIRSARELPRENVAMTILLTGIKEAKTNEELQNFLRKMKEAKVLTKERYRTLYNKGILNGQ